MSDLQLYYEPPGPVGAAFLQSIKPVQAIMGPIGSGKTSLCLMKMVTLAQQQRPSTIDGVRRFKFCVVRDTYRQLWKTTLKSWWSWFPRTLGTFVGSEDSPAIHTIAFRLADKSVVELIGEFIAIGENNVEEVLRGYEPTAFYLNEADTLAIEVFNYARGRAGRYPAMREGGPSWYGVLLDFNAPDTDSDIYKIFFEHKDASFDVFVQPSGFSPQAENLKNLPVGYYENQRSGQPDWYIRRMIENRFGASRDGKPVYEEFNDQRHVSAVDMEPVKGLPLILGADAGGSPAAVIGQRMPNGQWRLLDELVAEQGTGSNRFGENLARLLRDRYPGFRDLSGWADPSAAYGADKTAGEQDWIQIVAAKSGVRFRAAPTNALGTRLEAVRLPLTKTIDGTIPALIVSPRCKVLRKGFNSAYRYRRLHIPGQTRFSDEPEKNEWSHPHDAAQYLLLGGGEYQEVLGRKRHQGNAPRQTHAIGGEDDQSNGSTFRRGRYGGQTEALD